MSDLVITEAKSKRGLRYLHKYLQQVVYFYSIITKTCSDVFTCSDTAINKFTKLGGGGLCGTAKTNTCHSTANHPRYRNVGGGVNCNGR